MPRKVCAVYFSDHGEEIFNSADFAGHDMSKPTIDQIQIPFIYWFSGAYRRQRTEQLTAMRSHLSSFYLIDDLFHTILDVALIASPDLDPSRSLISEQFSPRSPQALRKVYPTLKQSP